MMFFFLGGFFFLVEQIESDDSCYFMSQKRDSLC